MNKNTPQEVAERFGLKYEPMKVSFRRKINLRELTSHDKNVLTEIVWLVGSCFIAALIIVILLFY